MTGSCTLLMLPDRPLENDDAIGVSLSFTSKNGSAFFLNLAINDCIILPVTIASLDAAACDSTFDSMPWPTSGTFGSE